MRNKLPRYGYFAAGELKATPCKGFTCRTLTTAMFVKPLAAQFIARSLVSFIDVLHQSIANPLNATHQHNQHRDHRDHY